MNNSQKMSGDSNNSMEISENEMISDKSETESAYFIPQIIDLVGNDCMNSVI